MRSIEIKIDSYSQIYESRECMQYDDLQLIIVLYQNGVPHTLTNCNLSLNWLNANETIALVGADLITKADNIATIKLPRDCTRTSGVARFELIMIDTDSKQETTFPLSIEVIQSVAQGQETSSNIATIIESLINANADAGATLITLLEAIKNATYLDVDKVDGFHASNNANSIPISNSTLNTNLNADMLDGQHANALSPSGQVAYFAMSTAPTGWLKCNGQSVSRITYSNLFAAIGTTFGTGDGATTFNLPDLRGEFIRGFDDGRGVDTGRAFGSTQQDELKAHRHREQAYSGANVNTGTTSNFYALQQGNGNEGGPVDQYTANTGGTETRPRNIALLACIKY